MEKIYIITHAFPYYLGEYFMESEINYYDGKDVVITFLPLSKGKNGTVRKLKKGISVDTFLCENPKKNTLGKIKTLLTILVNIYFYKEIFYIIRNRKLHFSTVKTAFLVASEILKRKKQFDLFISNIEFSNRIIFYSYWFDYQTYSLILLKKKYPGIKIICRAHGYDVFCERREFSYMPYKQQFGNLVDKIFAISKSGKKYLEKNYSINKENIEISRLGTVSPDCLSKISPDGALFVLSVSGCVAVKRIDRIIDGIVTFGDENPSINIIWTHIGDGEERERLEVYAKKVSSNKNVKCEFLGEVSNKEIHEYYSKQYIDVFINTSESEGVPVAIMEAMSYGVPIIAPNVGGIDEEVDTDNGILLEVGFDREDLASALYKLYLNKNSSIRTVSYNKWNIKYNAEKNYLQFIESIKLI